MQRRISFFVFPSACRLWTYSMVSGSWIILLTEIMYRALFRVLSPQRLSLCRMVLPDEAGIGLAPAREANAASERTRPGWDHAVRQIAAVTGPKPVSCSR